MTVIILMLEWIGLSSVLRPCQHSIGYMGDGFYLCSMCTLKKKGWATLLYHTATK